MQFKSKLKVVGIMSGTSLDGVDFVLCDIRRSPGQIKFADQIQVLFPRPLQKQLMRAANHEMKVDELALLHHDLGRFYAAALKEICRSEFGKLDLVGLHGQTVFHHAPHATLQIGEPSYISAELGVPVVADFRVADLALGGQGAPLATFFHAVLFEGMIQQESVAVQNLGGIGNVSYFEKNSFKGLKQRTGKKIFSFDTGPANMLMDLAIEKLTAGRKKFDQDGEMASRGIPDTKALAKWLKHPYFKVKPPKSCGREEFGEVFYKKAVKDLKGLSKEDQMATWNEFTALSIAESYRKHLPKLPSHLFLCGGGSKNSHLKFRIQYHLPETCVHTIEDAGWPTSAIEGGAFALMAALRAWDRAPHLPSTTGASRAGQLGKIVQV